MTMTYAPDGYVYMSVSTPTAFREILAPRKGGTKIELRRIIALEKMAENHGATVQTSTYQRG